MCSSEYLNELEAALENQWTLPKNPKKVQNNGKIGEAGIYEGRNEKASYSQWNVKSKWDLKPEEHFRERNNDLLQGSLCSHKILEWMK